MFLSIQNTLHALYPLIPDLLPVLLSQTEKTKYELVSSNTSHLCSYLTE